MLPLEHAWSKRHTYVHDTCRRLSWAKVHAKLMHRADVFLQCAALCDHNLVIANVKIVLLIFKIKLGFSCFFLQSINWTMEVMSKYNLKGLNVAPTVHLRWLHFGPGCPCWRRPGSAAPSEPAHETQTLGYPGIFPAQLSCIVAILTLLDFHMLLAISPVVWTRMNLSGTKLYIHPVISSGLRHGWYYAFFLDILDKCMPALSVTLVQKMVKSSGKWL